MKARIARFAALGLALAAPLAFASAASTYSITPGKSVLRYHVVHKLHKVDAESRELEGKVLLAPDGNVQLMVRARVASFKSGDGNRDEHMLETMEAQRFPFVTFKGLAHIQPPASYPATVDAQVEGELDFHGRKLPEAVRLSVTMRSPTDWQVTGGLQISLEKYQVERPSLLLVKLEDECKVDVDLQLVPST